MDDRCALCEERFTKKQLEGMAGDNSVAEMYDPTFQQAPALVHGSCGVSNGWEIA